MGAERTLQARVKGSDDGKAPQGARLRARGAQTKLVVGAADDSFEREADSMASAVVAALRSGASAPSIDGEPESGTIGRIRRSAVGLEGDDVDTETASELRSTRGGGSRIEPGVRSKMEGAFSADFSNVRIHSGPQSASLNERLQAKAFTLGSDVYFRDRVPDGNSSSGQELLAHELTHTIQQGGAAMRTSSNDRIRRAPRIQRAAAATLVKTALYKEDPADDTQVDDTDAGKSRMSVNPGDVLDVKSMTAVPGKSSGELFYKTRTVRQKDIVRYVKQSAVELIGNTATGETESASDKVDGVAGKIGETASILPEINDSMDAFKKASGDKTSDNALGVAAGVGDTITMFTDLASAIIAFRDNDASGSDKAGAILTGAAAIGTGAKGVSGIVDKAGGGDSATSAAQGLAGFADAFVGIKDTFFAIKHVVELVQNANKLNNQEKFKASMEIVSEAMSVAKSGVSSAKAFMDLWGGGAGEVLMNSVPGLGIALSAVDIIVRAVDLVSAVITRHDMQKRKRAIKTSALLGGAKGKSLKKDAEEFIKAVDERRERGEDISAADEEKYQAYEEYLLSKGLQYISSKRANRAILKIGVSMGKIAGDVAVLGGASAPVGIGIKVGAMAVDVGASLFRRFKQWGRDKAAAGSTGVVYDMFNADKSTQAKLAGYNKMVDKIFDMIIKATKMPVDQQEAATDQVKAFVKAMGLSVRQMAALKGDPGKLRESMIKAMKQRE